MELKHKSAAANKIVTCDCPVAGRWCEVEAEGWRTEDGRRRRTEGGSRVAAVEPACQVLEDGSWVADDDSRTTDEEPPATCCVDTVTCQLTRRRVSCSRSHTGSVPSEVVRNRRFVRTTYNVVCRFTYTSCV